MEIRRPRGEEGEGEAEGRNGAFGLRRGGGEGEGGGEGQLGHVEGGESEEECED